MGLAACQGAFGRNVQAVTYGEPTSCPSDEFESGPAAGTVIDCVGWTLHVPFGMDIELSTAASHAGSASMFDTDPVPIEITPDGHRVAYLDVRELRYLAKDLRSGFTRPITPRLTAEEIVAITSVVSSADSRHFAVSTRENRRTFVTDFETGRTRTLDQVCWAYGLTGDSLMGSAGCDGHDVSIDAIRFDGTATRFRSEEERPRDLSADLRWYIDFGEPASVYETATGRRVRVLPSELSEFQWAGADTLVARDADIEDGDDYIAIDARTGELISIGIPYSDSIVFGKVR
ncbi:hypothetical protein [Microbispora triticiradicis]|uniref:hypothetical protein n=1 Tax=Microbispora triticiradicis TaxID=2200763 RepID=UPI001AD6F7E3|nr:hypothetical protein [Microbispora triticiradicis]MBO4269272.1 hypothetical protein [Microbispora triticiradicis]